MGLLLQHVSSVVLLCVVMLLRDTFVADAEQTFINMMDLSWNCSMGCGPPAPMHSCLYPASIRFKENAARPVFSFSTKFLAVIGLGLLPPSFLGYEGSTGNILEGFTFALLPHPNAPLGGDGGYLGLLNSSSNGDPESHTLAVEFDFENCTQFSDPDEGFHIGIDVNSMNSTNWVSLEGPSDSRLWRLQVWIDYDGSTQVLNISTADIGSLNCPLIDDERPGRTWVQYNYTTAIHYNSLIEKVDLSNVLNEHMYAGFTSNYAIPQSLGLFDMAVGIDIALWSLRTSNSTSPLFDIDCRL